MSFPGNGSGIEAVYADAVERLVAAVEAAVADSSEISSHLSEGLGAGLGLLAREPLLARLLFVDVLSAPPQVRLEQERSLERLAEALRIQAAEAPGDRSISTETARLLASGLASHISGRVLAGETSHLPEDRDLLLAYLRAPGSAVEAKAGSR